METMEQAVPERMPSLSEASSMISRTIGARNLSGLGEIRMAPAPEAGGGTWRRASRRGLFLEISRL
jgi:hypothetical protein